MCAPPCSKPGSKGERSAATVTATTWEVGSIWIWVTVTGMLRPCRVQIFHPVTPLLGGGVEVLGLLQEQREGFGGQLPIAGEVRVNLERLTVGLQGLGRAVHLEVCRTIVRGNSIYIEHKAKCQGNGLDLSPPRLFPVASRSQVRCCFTNLRSAGRSLQCSFSSLSVQ